MVPPAMTAEKNGLVALVQKYSGVSLFTSPVSFVWEGAKNESLNAHGCQNFIQTRALNHWQFQMLLDELHAQYGELLKFAGLVVCTVLNRYFRLRQEIALFTQ